jgi:hypothetical protein
MLTALLYGLVSHIVKATAPLFGWQTVTNQLTEESQSLLYVNRVMSSLPMLGVSLFGRQTLFQNPLCFYTSMKMVILYYKSRKVVCFGKASILRQILYFLSNYSPRICSLFHLEAKGTILQDSISFILMTITFSVFCTEVPKSPFIGRIRGV